jgi:hypothetical protein
VTDTGQPSLYIRQLPNYRQHCSEFMRLMFTRLVETRFVLRIGTAASIGVTAMKHACRLPE